MPVTASQFEARRSGTDVRVTGTLAAPRTGWTAVLTLAGTDPDHDPSELRLDLTANEAAAAEPGTDSSVVVDQLFVDVGPMVSHVVVSLSDGIETERYGGDSLNLPIG